MNVNKANLDFLVGHLEGQARYKVYFPTNNVVQYIMNASINENIV